MLCHCGFYFYMELDNTTIMLAPASAELTGLQKASKFMEFVYTASSKHDNLTGLL